MVVVVQVFLTHITLGRKKDPSYINIRNPIPQKGYRIPNIDPVLCKYVMIEDMEPGGFKAAVGMTEANSMQEVLSPGSHPEFMTEL